MVQGTNGSAFPDFSWLMASPAHDYIDTNGCRIDRSLTCTCQIGA